MEDLHGPTELATGGDGAAEVERDLRAQNWILGRGGGRPQVRFEFVGASVGRLGEPELVKHAPALIVHGRLVERPPQIVDGGVGGTARAGLASRRSQPAHPLGIARRGKPDHVPADGLGKPLGKSNTGVDRARRVSVFRERAETRFC